MTRPRPEFAPPAGAQTTHNLTKERSAMERTQHLTQEDERLRRARAARLAADTRSVLAAIARHLTDDRPADPMRRPVREHLARKYARAAYGYTKRADDTEANVLRHAPAVAPGTTRSAYAALLRDTTAQVAQ